MAMRDKSQLRLRIGTSHLSPVPIEGRVPEDQSCMRALFNRRFVGYASLDVWSSN